MQTVNFEEIVDRIVRVDPRYGREAYHFVREALDYTQHRVHKDLARRPKLRDRHVSGQQLLDGVRVYALKTFGPMTLFVFHEWGLHRCEDFGEIVFNLVERGNGLFGKTEQDSRADFVGGYDFREAFERPFLPTDRRRRAVAVSRAE